MERMPLVQAKRTVFGVTAAMWLVVCAVVLLKLIRRAAEAPPATIEEYARTPSFQALNFVVGYLPSLIVALVVAIGAEYVALRTAERWRNGAKRS